MTARDYAKRITENAERYCAGTVDRETFDLHARSWWQLIEKSGPRTKAAVLRILRAEVLP